ncbi:amidohydrolase family protein [Leucobacter sp. CSA1]|uniref:Amidohydrolase family protein n=1 Tax=Leucobacter chromiisoli TaxID=2796471 RepID=A0A934Q7S7_9MICO|nr:amidohydrolase family protein [Leucobacter chromiisoli]MBK0418915.1 amidohydrolase family protein [Leucobacter chromiisoli]
MGEDLMRRVYRCEAVLPSARGRVRRDVGVLVESGRILAVEPFAELSSEAETIRLPGLTMPGLVDAHTHLRCVPSASQARLPGRSFEQWVYALAALTPLPLLDDAAVAAGELVRAGVTSAQVMVHSWSDADGRLDELAAVVSAVEAAGLRALLVVGLTDQAEFSPMGGTAGAPDSGAPELGAPERGLPIERWGSFVQDARRIVDAASERITLGVGPVAPQWCSDAALREIAEHRGELRVHTHLLESPLQRDWLGDGRSPVSRLEESGLLGDFASAAHGVHLADDELDRLAAMRTAVVHCPTSNSVLGVGDARVADWLERGIDAALGLDSQTLPPDPFEEMREALRCGERLGHGISAADALDLATRGGAAALGFAAGTIAPGRYADFITLDLDLDLGSGADGVAAEGIVRRAHSGLVRHAVIGGEDRHPVNEERHRELAELSQGLQRVLDEDAGQRAARLRALEEPLQTIRTLGVRQR